jgi:trehalose synthase
MTRVAVRTDGPSLEEGYRPIVGPETLRVLEGVVRRLKGRRLVMVNSTAAGGGVAEILHRLVRLLNEMGLPTEWEVMPGDARFYGITKAIHNALHGAPATITPSDWDHFMEVSRAGARQLALDGDLIMIHDPQPVALESLRRRPGQTWVWRCHIDLSTATREVLEVIESHVKGYDAAVFSHHAFVPLIQVPSFLVPPSIDPMSDKNRILDLAEERSLLAPFDLPSRKPLVVQVSRFDRLKDPVGVIEAFVHARRWEDAHLVLAGGTADDDPEGAEVLAEVEARAAGRSDVTLLSLPPDAHLVINALQRRATVVVQKSLREGFALTVSEALWKQRAVIAGAVGGIPLQVIHDQTGVLVRSVEGCAYQLTRLLRAADLRKRLGQNGREHVRQLFLLPREARDYLAVFAQELARRN